MSKPTRGPSAASKDAEAYVKRNPNASATQVAEKFKINVSTVFRAAWWKNRAKGE